MNVSAYRSVRRFLTSTLNRLVLTYGIALLFAFVVIGGLSLAAFDQLVERDTRQTVLTDHKGLLAEFQIGGRAGLAKAVDDRVGQDADREAVYLLVDPDGTVRSGHLGDLPAPLLHRHGWVRFPWNEEGDYVLAYIETLPDGGELVTGHSTGEQQHLRDLIARLGLAILSLLAALTLGLAWLLRRAVDRALKAPLDAVDRVTAGHLDERVPEREGHDAFARLGRTLNRMLDRIHALVGGIQSSTDAIAHDLRTPLMRLRVRLEQARQESSDAAAKLKIDAAVAEADQLMATFNSLLRLARIESAQDLPVERVALDQVLGDAVEMWQAVAESRGQAIEMAIEPARVAGDRDLLFQMLSNLLDNAIKYGGEYGRVRVALRTADNEVLLDISDQGPGIPSEQHERVFDRFVRGESHRGTPGTGLGLSVVRAIAIRHGAELRLESASPGLRVLLRFPAA